MTSYLIITHNKTLGKEKAELLCNERNISEFDTSFYELANTESKTGTKKSWGIDDIKQLQKKIYLKPMMGEWKAVLLADAETLTHEAQNALLKLLEEPPSGTIIILLSTTEKALIPTILSRCHIIKLADATHVHHDDYEQIKNEILTLSSSPLGDRLKKAEILSKNKEEALLWIKNAVQSELKKPFHTSTTDHLQLLNKTHQILTSTNVNTRLALEQLFLSLK